MIFKFVTTLTFGKTSWQPPHVQRPAKSKTLLSGYFEFQVDESTGYLDIGDLVDGGVHLGNHHILKVLGDTVFMVVLDPVFINFFFQEILKLVVWPASDVPDRIDVFFGVGGCKTESK